ncbi:hypothetical protein [Deinococcus roseus]|uniref:Uncharacterized protein n=1 Tax=Deinococcus roseus TaxID=392414 RepID=A0ABQ2D0Q5_9DEIO|nr:hypothetical protein [Deinococcus roseus]GGJ39886.1 hypothetical protein GCM10008938_27370 [Deinococcus roseus]
MNTPDYSLNFSAYEWEELCEAPVLAGITVMDAHPSGWLGSLEELRSLKACLAPVPDDHSLIVEVKKSILAQDLIGPERQKSFAEIRERTLQVLRNLSAVLPDRLDEPSQTAYLQFIKNLMERVADAAREGGILGSQTQNISPQERAVIEELSRALDPE